MKARPKRQTRLLMVEDEDAHAELFERVLSQADFGIALTRVRDGQEALDYLARHDPFEEAPRPDVVLLDMQLPKLSGLEVLRFIRQTPDLANLPVVALTMSDSDRLLFEAQSLHVNSFLRKPLDLGAFQELARDLGLYWGVWNRPRS